MFNWLKPQSEPVRQILDVAFLERLEQHLGRVVVDELLADGIIELSDRVEQLETLAMEGNYDDMAKLAHDIAGFSGHLGLARLSYLAVELTRHARNQDAIDPFVMIAPVIDSARPSIDALEAYCRRTPLAGEQELSGDDL